MSLLEKLRKDNSELRKLRYTDFGNKEPLITKPLPKVDEQTGRNPLLGNNVVAKSLTDVLRVSKFLTTGSGVKFIANQALLIQAQNGGKVLRTIPTLAKTLGKLIAQVGVTGLGIRLESGAISKYVRNRSNFVVGEEGQETLDEKVNQSLNANKETGIKNRKHDTDRVDLYNDKRTYGENSQPNFVIPIPGEGLGFPTKFNTPASVGNLNKATEARKVVKESLRKNQETYRSTFGLSLSGSADRLNLTTVNTVEISGESNTLIEPISFIIREPGKNPDYIRIRAYVESFTDNYNASWNSTSYIGRAEPVHNYTGFKRDFSFKFKIAAHSKAELIPLYRKLETLVSSTAPSYSDTFMRGVLVEVKIGDYLNSPGFFTSFGISWDTMMAWEIGYGSTGSDFKKEDGGKILPHSLDIQANFTPIHTNIPQSIRSSVENTSAGTFIKYV